MMTHQMLTHDMNLRKTLQSLKRVELPASSRFKFGSPCRFVRILDIFIHIIIPEILEKVFPRVASYLRNTSPRWGRSWRQW